MPDISLQHMIAVMLIDGTASFAAAHDRGRMADPAVLKQRAKVKLVRSDELEKLEPDRAAIVDITLNDGTVLSDRVTAVRGTYTNPMTREEVVQKARDLVDPVLGRAGSAKFIDTMLNIEKVKNVRELRSALQKA
jgi:2-methylcitrate dehydratase PrpD